MAHTRRLDSVEARVVGALMEKEQTTPDLYPLTVNSLLSACNQKSNRQPVTSHGEQAIRDALNSLRKDVLVWRVDGTRVERWEHRLSGRWHLDPAGKAIMTLLLLRGAQTPGELRSRSERLHGFGEVSEVEAKLRDLAHGDDPLVRELAREPGQRENRWRHVMLRPAEGEPEADAAEVQPVAATAAAPPEPGPRGFSSDQEGPGPTTTGASGDRVEQLASKIAELESRIQRLESQGTGR